MSVGVWEPAAGEGSEGKSSQRTVDSGLLQRFLVPALTLDEASDGRQIELGDVASESWVMALTAAAWQEAEKLSVEEIIALIRFFTLVEAGVSGWEAGAKSPVIPLVKLLKGRDEFTPELRRWIKANTDNRYLPYGSAL